MLFILAGNDVTAQSWADQLELMSREVLFVSPAGCGVILRGVRGGKFIVHESWYEGPFHSCRRQIIESLAVCRITRDVERQAILDIDERERRRYRIEVERQLARATQGVSP